jgi:hypothetical protein
MQNLAAKITVLGQDCGLLEEHHKVGLDAGSYYHQQYVYDTCLYPEEIGEFEWSVPNELRLLREKAKLLINQKPAETKKEKQTNGGKKQSWEDDAVDYMLLSEAIVKFAGNKPAVSTLSKKITPNGSIRYMRRGRRCKVHIGDFREYAQNHYPSDVLAAEIADEYMADIEARKAKERKRRQESK